MNKTEQVMRFLVGQHDGKLGHTRLAKLVYLVDFEARRYLGRPVSDLEYSVARFGPFDAPRFYGHRDVLVTAGAIEEEGYESEGRRRHRFHARGTSPDLSDFTPGERQIIRAVSDRFGHFEAHELLTIVYGSEPWRHVSRSPVGTPVPMALIDGEGRGELGGLDLDQVMRGVEDVRAGRVVSGAEVERGIQARVLRGGNDHA